MNSINQMIIIFVVAGIVSTECIGAVVTLRDGSTVSGEIISCDDTNCVLRTREEMQTIPWRRMKNRSIEQLHPELYTRLMRNKGMIYIKGIWMTSEEAENMKKILFRSILLGVRTKEKTGPWTRENSKGITIYGNARSRQRICKGSVTIELVNLSPYETYVLRVQITHIVKGGKAKEVSRSRTDNVNYYGYKTDRTGTYTTWVYGIHTNEITETVTIESSREYKGSFKTPEYINMKKNRGLRSIGFNITVWLNDTLVYKGIHREIPRYYYVGKL